MSDSAIMSMSCGFFRSIIFIDLCYIILTFRLIKLKIMNKSNKTQIGTLVASKFLNNAAIALLIPIIPYEAIKRDVPTIVIGLIFSIGSLADFMSSYLFDRIIDKSGIKRITMIATILNVNLLLMIVIIIIDASPHWIWALIFLLKLDSILCSGSCSGISIRNHKWLLQFSR